MHRDTLVLVNQCNRPSLLQNTKQTQLTIGYNTLWKIKRHWHWQLHKHLQCAPIIQALDTTYILMCIHATLVVRAGDQSTIKHVINTLQYKDRNNCNVIFQPAPRNGKTRLLCLDSSIYTCLVYRPSPYIDSNKLSKITHKLPITLYDPLLYTY